jgi:hypothetical protein
METKEKKTSDFNSGYWNSGYFNSGGFNSGDFNSGDRNSGNCNSGDRNSGNFNSGDWNSGNFNSGDCNSGDRNSGNFNSGDWNSGNFNSGDCNSGDRNSGNFNSGDRNSGNFNSGDCNSGFFCTETQKPMFFDKKTDLSWEKALKLIPEFNLPVCCEWVRTEDMTEQEKQQYPSHATTGGYLKSNPMPLKESFPIAWAKLSVDEKKKWLCLPNFDADKFLQITGVDVRKEKIK